MRSSAYGRQFSSSTVGTHAYTSPSSLSHGTSSLAVSASGSSGFTGRSGLSSGLSGLNGGLSGGSSALRTASVTASKYSTGKQSTYSHTPSYASSYNSPSTSSHLGVSSLDRAARRPSTSSNISRIGSNTGLSKERDYSATRADYFAPRERDYSSTRERDYSSTRDRDLGTSRDRDLDRYGSTASMSSSLYGSQSLYGSNMGSVRSQSSYKPSSALQNSLHQPEYSPGLSSVSSNRKYSRLGSDREVDSFDDGASLSSRTPADRADKLSAIDRMDRTEKVFSFSILLVF